MILKNSLDPPTGGVASDLGGAAASRLTLMLSSATAAFLPLLRFAPPHIPAPEAFSAAIPYACHAFVISIIFAFTCSFTAVLLHTKSPAARVLRLTAIACLSSAMLLLFLYVLALFYRPV